MMELFLLAVGGYALFCVRDSEYQRTASERKKQAKRKRKLVERRLKKNNVPKSERKLLAKKAKENI